ncbi:MAG TPA: DinB family protein [Gemmatimonadales bacterium]|nr:DinB family protein [Gemmatimonadales bacterium]
MTFSNPAGKATASATSYVRSLLEVLGSRDPLDVLSELMPWLTVRLRGVAEPVLRRPESPGKWSVIEVIQHLADSDLVASYRIKMVLTEDRPPLQGYDQDRWAAELRYGEVPLGLALEQLTGLRAANLHLWKQLTPQQLERVGIHAERGPESVAHLLRLMAAHDLVHRRQIERILVTAR